MVSRSILHSKKNFVGVLCLFSLVIIVSYSELRCAVSPTVLGILKDCSRRLTSVLSVGGSIYESIHCVHDHKQRKLHPGKFQCYLIKKTTSFSF